MVHLQVKLKFNYHLLVACLLQRLEWYYSYETSEIFQLRNGSISNPETLNFLAQSVASFLSQYPYEKCTIEQVFDIKIVFLRVKRRNVSLIKNF